MPRREGEKAPRHQARVKLAVKTIEDRLKAWAVEEGSGRARVLIDRYSRPLYKRYGESDTPLNRVLVRGGSGRLLDMADFSPIIGAAQPFEVCRAYVFRDDKEAETVVENTIRTPNRRKKP